MTWRNINIFVIYFIQENFKFKSALLASGHYSNNPSQTHFTSVRKLLGCSYICDDHVVDPTTVYDGIVLSPMLIFYEKDNANIDKEPEPSVDSKLHTYYKAIKFLCPRQTLILFQIYLHM